jgi:hypothetical protein
MIVEPVQPLDGAPAAGLETEVEQLRRYLEVSQATLEVAEWEMQVIQDKQVAADSRVVGEFFVRYFYLKDHICFSHSSCSCVGQN